MLRSAKNGNMKIETFGNKGTKRKSKPLDIYKPLAYKCNYDA
ncbi:hypothetical protein ASZ90_006997 [hydrocarbon metagenome]|uniref:Uncharacterized protein n=1 Tax=hydrocarbon metagenome TaxID=938273 RepID=A0A0W8FQN1_9ZZZZ